MRMTFSGSQPSPSPSPSPNPSSSVLPLVSVPTVDPNPKLQEDCGQGGKAVHAWRADAQGGQFVGNFEPGFGSVLFGLVGGVVGFPARRRAF
jgi:hypothetical protein